MTDTVLTAAVAVDRTAFHFDKPYDYRVPERLRDRVKPGCRVSVSFGSGPVRQGMVMALHETGGEGLKELKELLDQEPVLSEELLYLAEAMKERCCCTLFEACKAMLPAGLSVKLTYCYSPAGEIDESALA